MFRSMVLFTLFLRSLPQIIHDIRRLEVRGIKFQFTLRSMDFPLFYFEQYGMQAVPELGTDYSLRLFKLCQLWVSLKGPHEDVYLEKERSMTDAFHLAEETSPEYTLCRL